MNKKFNMVLMVSIIFLISFAGDCNEDPPASSNCTWGTLAYRFNAIPEFSHPPSPLFEFTQSYPDNPIFGISPILYDNQSDGYAYIKVTAGTSCGDENSKEQKYDSANDGLGESVISFVPDPKWAEFLSSVRVDVYSKKYYNWDDAEYVRVFWTKTYDKQPVSNHLEGSFTIATHKTFDEDQYKAKPIYKDGGLQDPV